MSPDSFAANNRVLVIDDNRSIHDDFRKVLCADSLGTDLLNTAEQGFFGEAASAPEQPRFHVDSAYQGQEALDVVAQGLAEHRRYAMAFVDVRIPPGLDGIETVARLWKIDPEVQVVICTAFSDYAWDQIATRLGRNHSWVILKKPFDNVEVLQLASALTEKWQFLQESKRQFDDLEVRFLRAQRMESIGTLASGVAHDLNNILTPVLLAIGMLRANRQGWEESELLEVLEANTKRGVGIVKQLLTFARGARGERVPLVVEHLLLEMVAMAKETFPKSIRVRNQIDPDLSMVSGNATQLLQVLMNLCVNARDVMPTGGDMVLRGRNHRMDALDVALNPEAAAGPYVLIEVSDTGGGIEPAVLPRIFDPFFTTKEPGKGTGLGLSTAMEIVKGLGGVLRVQSKLGHGTTFQIYLPAVDQPAQADAPTPAPVSAVGGKGRLILLVDDELSIRTATQLLLQRYGYEVITASDGAHGLLRFCENRERVRLVVTDLMMPVMDGRALILELTRTQPGLPIVVHSGAGDGPGLDELKQLGVRAFLSKPYTPEDLLRAVEAALIDGGTP